MSCNSQNNAVTKKISDLYVGMTIQEFEDILPDIVIPENNIDFQTGKDKDDVFGLTGGWAFNFKDGILNWFMMNSYSDVITEENYQKYEEAYLGFKSILEETFGKPYEDITHNVRFKDPYIERHWGYDVSEAIWKNSKMKFKLIFTFMGGKGEYHFLLKAEFHNNDYEYY